MKRNYLLYLDDILKSIHKKIKNLISLNCQPKKHIFLIKNRREKIMNSREQSFIGLASENDLRIALHYKDAFEILYKSDKYQEQIVIPALFMVRQFVELGLKYNITILKDISHSQNLVHELTTTHDLQKLYHSFLDHYKNAKKNQKLKCLKDGELLENLKLLVNSILAFDHNSMGARYSNGRDGSKMIDINEKCNLKEIYTLLESVSGFLSNIEEVIMGK